jgi:GntR family transcriptional regulator
MIAMTPKYYQLATALREQISSGQLHAGAQLPPEETISKAHQLSRGTVRKAIDLLLQEGLITRHQGRGTFITTPPHQSTHFSLSSFSQEMRRQRRTPATRVLAFEVIPATARVAERLILPRGTPVFHIERIRLADNLPVAHEIRYLPEFLCPALIHENLETQSIHWLLVKKFTIALVRMEHIVELCTLTHDQAMLLRATSDQTAFSVDRLTYTRQGVEQIPAVWFQATYREDTYNMTVQSIHDEGGGL